MAKLIWGKARQLKFKDNCEYYWALGSLCRSRNYTITFETNSETDSWADAYRIRCLAGDNLIPEAFIRALRDNRRINCNEYVQNLCDKHGFEFEMGSKTIYGRYDVVKKTVPEQFIRDFDAGYQGKKKYDGAGSTFIDLINKANSSKLDYNFSLPEEIQDKDANTLREGQKSTITVNAYERNAEARKRCLEYYYKINGGKIKCEICGFDFSKKYGEAFKDKIHVHHIVEISSIGEEYVIDPTKDLLPVCPNCHMVIHSKKPAFTIEAMKELIKQAQ